MSSLVENVRTTIDLLRLLPLKFARQPQDDDIDSLGLQLQLNAQRFRDRPMIKFEGQELTWGEFNALTNQYADFLIGRGIGAGDCVSLLMENRIEQLACVFAIQKVGAIAGLINTNLRGRQLEHCITVTESRFCIVGEELSDAVDEIRGNLNLTEGEDYLYVPDAGTAPTPNWALNASEAIANCSTENPAGTAAIRAGNTCLYIFTSGTTGMPKAAIVSHRRYMGTARLFGANVFRAKPTDRMYICLPLYHGTGLLLGVGSCLATGASMFVRRRFSASNFLREVREENTNLFVYIGELCRYLMNQPEQPDDANNPIERIVGNGLRPDIWDGFRKRFGIDRVGEFYGASEGNAGFVNLLNKDRTIGMTIYDVALIEYDVDADEIVRDANGRCPRVADGEPGLLISKIEEKARFEGYTNEEATEKKILRDVFEPGDAWFNSGDLLCTVDVGWAVGQTHYQFVDRVGDTFRWKSENVSTNEVGEIISGHPQVDICNVYGVEIPGTDGRAGMAAIVPSPNEPLDVTSLSSWVRNNLPSYAQPVFIRVQRDMEVTGTFKLVKGDLRKQGYDPAASDDEILVMRPRSDRYEPLNDDFHEQIRSGAAGY